MKIQNYKMRFVDESFRLELINLWHLSKVPCCTSKSKRYDRLQWTVKEFNKVHTEYSPTAIYKDLDAITEGY